MTKTRKRRVSDVLAGPEGAEGALPFSEVIGKEAVIRGFAVVSGKYGPLAFIDCETDDDAFKVRTGSAVVLDQLERIAAELPLLAEFCQEKNYYHLR